MLIREHLEKHDQDINQQYRAYEALGKEVNVISATLLGFGRILNIPPEEFARIMVEVNHNADYEAQVYQAFQMLTGRTTDSLGAIVEQEQKKRKTK